MISGKNCKQIKSSPGNHKAGAQGSDDPLQRDDNAQCRQHDDGQDAVTQDTDHNEEADGGCGHEGEEAVDGEAPQDADAVYVVEVNLACEQQQGAKGEAESLRKGK